MISKTTATLLAAACTTALVTGTSQAASLVTDFQATVSSEQSSESIDEGRYFHVSVNPNNAGTGVFASTIVGTNDPAADFVRNYDAPVIGYRFAGGTNNDITAIAMSGGDVNRIVFATTDTSFDGFKQTQAKVWDATDPGADLAIGDGLAAVADQNSGGYRSLGGATGTFDITGLASGSVNFYYGAFSSTPTISVVMRDTDGAATDFVIGDGHLNGDAANRSEYYLAEFDFVTDGIYDEIIVTWDSDGDGDLATGNGRGVGAVLTGNVIPEPGSLALLGLGGLLIARRRRG